VALDAGDPRNEVLAAWLAKEHLCEVYATVHPDRADRLLGEVIDECAQSNISELNTLAATLTRWRTAIINRHRSGDSNGPTEAINLLIKNIKRAGCGYRNFHHYRLRLLAHRGLIWEYHRVAPLRGRAPPVDRVAPPKRAATARLFARPRFANSESIMTLPTRWT
jgi:hypothetical protein